MLAEPALPWHAEPQVADAARRLPGMQRSSRATTSCSGASRHRSGRHSGVRKPMARGSLKWPRQERGTRRLRQQRRLPSGPCKCRAELRALRPYLRTHADSTAHLRVRSQPSRPAMAVLESGGSLGEFPRKDLLSPDPDLQHVARFLDSVRRLAQGRR